MGTFLERLGQIHAQAAEAKNSGLKFTGGDVKNEAVYVDGVEGTNLSHAKQVCDNCSLRAQRHGCSGVDRMGRIIFSSKSRCQGLDNALCNIASLLQKPTGR